MVPLAIEYLFQRIQNETDKDPRAPYYKLFFSHLEIYNEKVIDLMSSKPTDLPIRQDADGHIHVANLTEVGEASSQFVLIRVFPDDPEVEK